MGDAQPDAPGEASDRPAEGAAVETRRPGRGGLWLPAVLAVVAVAAWVRWGAARQLPADFDEYVYVRLGYRYAERMAPGRWAEIPAVTENAEHPPLVKLAYGVALRATRAPEPDWKAVEAGKPLPAQARPAYRVTRALSATAGVAQVALAAAVSPAAGLWLALDTYHAKFTAQAYLEGLAGLFALLAVLLFERALRRPGPAGLLPARSAPAAAPLLLSAAALALATASKYPFGLVAGMTILPFLLWRTRGSPGLLLAYGATGLAVFTAADPYLWVDTLSRLWGSAAFHFSYAVGGDVQRSALPWWQPLVWLADSAPAEWHPGLFPVTFLDRALLVAAVLAAPAALARRPVLVVWAAVGLVFLLAWPTKWPQYTVMVRPALALCVGLGLSALWEWLAGRRRAPVQPTGP